MSSTSKKISSPKQWQKHKPSPSASRLAARKKVSLNPKQPKRGALASAPYKIGSKATETPQASTSKSSRRSSNSPASSPGLVARKIEFPKALWSALSRDAKLAGMPAEVFTVSRLRVAFGLEAGESPLTIILAPKTAAAVLKVAEATSATPSEMVETHFGSDLREWLAEERFAEVIIGAQCWTTPEEAVHCAIRANESDNAFGRSWAILKDRSGCFHAEDEASRIAERMADGWKVVGAVEFNKGKIFGKEAA